LEAKYKKETHEHIEHS